MKKLFFVLSIALSVSLAACNGSGDKDSKSTDSTMNSTGEQSSSASSQGAYEPVESTDTVMTQSEALDSTQQAVALQGGVPQPGMPQTNSAPALKTPTPPMKPEDVIKYKEAITLLKSYGDKLVKCLESKQVDDSAKQQIKELQDKLTELQKAGKMNQNLIDLFNANNEMYNKLLNQ